MSLHERAITILANLTSDLALDELAAVANMSKHHFCRRFKLSAGVTPHVWVIRTRIREAERLLRTGNLSIVEVALIAFLASNQAASNSGTEYVIDGGTVPTSSQGAPGLRRQG